MLFPHEVEESLRSHPDVREAVMFTSSDPDRLERVHARSPSAGRVADGAAAALPGPGARGRPERPRHRADPPAVPLNGLGKPDLPALRALAGERSGRAVTALGARMMV
ncbi:hypothetical protein ACIGXI_19405 [Kitasatospora aureofaciens]|uniref:hypothetical protein n=1 Tax=Kitasatospora aureofaciens TaxID=1894 RepID=UPI0037C7FA42